MCSQRSGIPVTQHNKNTRDGCAELTPKNNHKTTYQKKITPCNASFVSGQTWSPHRRVIAARGDTRTSPTVPSRRTGARIDNYNPTNRGRSTTGPAPRTCGDTYWIPPTLGRLSHTSDNGGQSQAERRRIAYTASNEPRRQKEICIPFVSTAPLLFFSASLRRTFRRRNADRSRHNEEHGGKASHPREHNLLRPQTWLCARRCLQRIQMGAGHHKVFANL